MWVRSLGWEELLEKEMAAHSSILAWRIPWTGEPGGYSPRGHKESDRTVALWEHTHMHHYSIMQSVFTALKILCALPVYLPLCPQIPGNRWSFYCLHSFAFSWILYSITVAFQMDFLYLVIRMKVPSRSFLGLRTHFFLVSNAIPLSYVARFIYPFKKDFLTAEGLLVASSCISFHIFWTL